MALSCLSRSGYLITQCYLPEKRGGEVKGEGALGSAAEQSCEGDLGHDTDPEKGTEIEGWR